uniref:C-type lectin domain-containing protein n=1 Tax=Anas platyrhynchos TaxID=8839 RepID=A0A8B9T1U1_ANAPL
QQTTSPLPNHGFPMSPPDPYKSSDLGGFSCSSYPQFSHMCPDTWIGFQSKCYYFSENRNDWNTSLENCKALEASLTSIDSLEELHFLLHYGRPLHYWVGLHREGSDPWRWCNGSLFNNLFDIQGNGQCAYLNPAGVSSDWCSQLKYSVCSHPLKSPRGA